MTVSRKFSASRNTLALAVLAAIAAAPGCARALTVTPLLAEIAQSKKAALAGFRSTLPATQPTPAQPPAQPKPTAGAIVRAGAAKTATVNLVEPSGLFVLAAGLGTLGLARHRRRVSLIFAAE